MNPYNDIQPNTDRPLLPNDQQQQQYGQQPQYGAPQQPQYGAPQQDFAPPQQVQPQNPYAQPVPNYGAPVYQQPAPLQIAQQPAPILVQPQAYYQQPGMVQVTMPGMPNFPTEPRGRKPEQFMCGLCQKQMVSQTEFKTGNGGLLLGAGLCIIGCWICAPFVFCTEDCQDAVHYCPQCKREVGRQKFLLN